MGQKTEFEESEYEGPLYSQLLNGNLNIWTPGRRFERFFGIDSALYTKNHYFWNLFNQTPPVTGTILRNHNWHYLLRIINRHFKRFPSYNVNLLIQSKRPKHRNGINSSFSSQGIKGQYWQFEITLHQQRILEQLEQKLGNDAIVVYACPAFHKFDDLDSFTANGQIIENSTFVKVGVLTNHSKWVFNKAGTTGIACSEIKKHSDISFKEMIRNIREKKQENEDYNKFDFLKKIVFEICENNENSQIIKAFLRRNKILKECFYSISKEFEDNLNYENYNNFISFITFLQFSATLNTQWFSIV